MRLQFIWRRHAYFKRKCGLLSCNSLWADTNQIVCWQVQQETNSLRCDWKNIRNFACACPCNNFLSCLWFINVQTCVCAHVPLHVCLDVFITSPHRKSAEEDCSKYFYCGNGSWLTNFVMELRIWDAYIKTSHFTNKSTYENVFFSGLRPNNIHIIVIILQKFQYHYCYI